MSLEKLEKEVQRLLADYENQYKAEIESINIIKNGTYKEYTVRKVVISLKPKTLWQGD